ncbi:hypothetical protein [Streptomyces xinghaiensis]|uniref:hypothetical protein n=1 Tax=Streptomyces xinghaiensis TaxID=1038928 RepID=UPI002E0D2D94|nr:hypothetical protein OG463_13875 [Streptomyces xinghaiensis]
MTEHADPALLAELALGNRPSAGEGAEADPGSAGGGTETRAAEHHLAACPRCRDTLAVLRRIIGAARNVSPDDRVTAPPEALWESIAAELGLTGVTGATGASGVTGGGTPGSRLRSRLRRTGPVEPVPVRPAEHPAEPGPAAHSVPLRAVPAEEAVPQAAVGEPAQPEAAEAEPVPARPGGTGGTGGPPGDSTR